MMGLMNQNMRLMILMVIIKSNGNYKISYFLFLLQFKMLYYFYLFIPPYSDENNPLNDYPDEISEEKEEEESEASESESEEHESESGSTTSLESEDLDHDGLSDDADILSDNGIADGDDFDHDDGVGGDGEDWR